MSFGLDASLALLGPFSTEVTRGVKICDICNPPEVTVPFPRAARVDISHDDVGIDNRSFGSPYKMTTINCG